MARVIVHNHLPRRRTVDAAIQVKSGPLDREGIALVEVFGAAGKVGSGFWDTHASAYWIRPNGGPEKMFQDKADIVKFFESRA
jgi:hypothetical protein